MEQNMHVYQRILFLVIYTLVYAGLALENIGTEGKGSAIFLASLSTWVLVGIAVLLLSPHLTSFRRIFIAVLMGIHYGVTLLSVLQTAYNDDGSFLHSWQRSPGAFIFGITWYVAGQLIIWFFILRGWRSEPQMP